MGFQDPRGETWERENHVCLYNRFTYWKIFIQEDDGHHYQDPWWEPYWYSIISKIMGAQERKQQSLACIECMCKTHLWYFYFWCLGELDLFFYHSIVLPFLQTKPRMRFLSTTYYISHFLYLIHEDIHRFGKSL